MMPKRTFLLIAGVTVAVLALLVSLSNKSETPLKQQVFAPTPTPVAQTVLTLSPNPLIVQNNASSHILNVNIQAGQNKITAVQLEMLYDPKVLTNVDIVPGTFFTKPTVLLKEIDQVKGRISWAIGVVPTGEPAGGTGIVANISFTPVAKNQSTEIRFLPKTLVTAQGIEQSTLKSTTGSTIILSSSP